MPQFSVTRSVPYTAQQVFDIARDVARYKEFVPLVKRSFARNPRIDENGVEHVDGELTVAYPKLGIEEVLTSRATIDPATLTVTSCSDQPPVKHLVAEWKIVPTGDNRCDINFSLDYQMRSKMLQLMLSGMFDMAVRKIMSAFEERARQLYGPAIS